MKRQKKIEREDPEKWLEERERKRKLNQLASTSASMDASMESIQKTQDDRKRQCSAEAYCLAHPS